MSFFVKAHFWQKKTLFAERKNGRFSVIPARTGSVVILGQALSAHLLPCRWVGWWLWREFCNLQDNYLLGNQKKHMTFLGKLANDDIDITTPITKQK